MSELATKFAELGVATVYEAAGRTGLVEMPLVQLLPGTSVAGPARPVACGQGDNLMVHAAIERVQPGDVVVLSMPREEAVGLIGELLVTQIMYRGAAAVLSNGGMRDVAELREMGLPIWSRFVSARGATKSLVGSLDTTIEIGGASIAVGDMVVLDDDGATMVPSARIEEVASKSEERLEREAKMRKRLENGELSLEIHGLRKLLDDDESDQSASKP